MYDQELARQLLAILEKEFPNRMDGWRLREELQNVSSYDEILRSLDALEQQGKVMGRFLRGPNDSIADAAQVSITDKGRAELSPRASETPGKASSKDFTFIRIPQLRTVIERDYGELCRLNPQATPKAVLVMAGAIVEGTLLDALVTSGRWDFEEGSQRQLTEMIGPAKAKGIITQDHLSEAVKRYRNLVHPGREVRNELRFDDADARLAHSAVDIILREVRDWFLRQNNVSAAPIAVIRTTGSARRSAPFLPASEQALDVRLLSGSGQAFALLVASNADEELEIVGVAAEQNGSPLGTINRPPENVHFECLAGTKKSKNCFFLRSRLWALSATTRPGAAALQLRW